MLKPLFTQFLISIMSTFYASAQTNYDESLVPSYQLPELLKTQEGENIHNVEDWRYKRRQEIIGLFEQEVYGKTPDTRLKVAYEINELDYQAFEGKALIKEVVVTFSNEAQTLDMNILMFLPSQIQEPAPLFLGMNFNGNHTIHAHPGIPITQNWVRNSEALGINDHQATAAARGTSASRWPIEEILARGYGVATIYYGDVDPDYDDGFLNGIHGLMGTPRKGDSWGSLAAWAWGLSRAMDYLETDEAVENDAVILLGHSRLGKAALWAGAMDERFAMVISNDSGCGGAALSRRQFGERVANINGSFPHWFCENFRQYNNREQALPIDQHQLLALIAPRPLYVASAQDDLWADPKGEYLSLYHAGPVYELYGYQILDSTIPPEVDSPVCAGKVGYHRRSGKHDLTIYDWKQYLDFADRWRAE